MLTRVCVTIVALSFASLAGRSVDAQQLGINYCRASAPGEPTSVIVGYVQPNSTAHFMGIRPNDRILQVNGHLPNTTGQFRTALRIKNGAVDLVVERNGQRVSLKQGLLSDDALARPVGPPSLKDLGVNASIFKDVSQRTLVRIDSVTPGSPAESMGFEARQFIDYVNGIPIRSMEDIDNAIRSVDVKTVYNVQRRARKDEDITVWHLCL